MRFIPYPISESKEEIRLPERTFIFIRVCYYTACLREGNKDFIFFRLESVHSPPTSNFDKWIEAIEYHARSGVIRYSELGGSCATNYKEMTIDLMGSFCRTMSSQRIIHFQF